MSRSLATALTETMRPSYTLTAPSASAATAAAPTLTIEPGAPLPSVPSLLPGTLHGVVARELVARLRKADLTDPAVWDHLVGPGPEGLAALLRIAEEKIAQGGVIVHAAPDDRQAAPSDAAVLAARESQVAGTLQQLQSTGRRYDVLHAMFATSGHQWFRNGNGNGNGRDRRMRIYHSGHTLGADPPAQRFAALAELRHKSSALPGLAEEWHSDDGSWTAAFFRAKLLRAKHRPGGVLPLFPLDSADASLIHPFTAALGFGHASKLRGH